MRCCLSLTDTAHSDSSVQVQPGSLDPALINARPDSPGEEVIGYGDDVTAGLASASNLFHVRLPSKNVGGDDRSFFSNLWYQELATIDC